MEQSELTQAIMKVHETQSSDESVEELLSVLKGLYKWDMWVFFASKSDDEGNVCIQSIYIDNVPHAELIGYYLVGYSDLTYVGREFGQSVAATSIRKVFKVFVENYEKGECKGIVLNPNSEAEMVILYPFIFSCLDSLNNDIQFTKNR